MKKQVAAWIVLLAFGAGMISGCGPAREEELTDEDLEGMFDGTGPYPNIRGGDVRGDKNFASLINKYQEGKGDGGYAGFFWPYTANGIASSATGSSGGGGRGYSAAGKYDAARGGTVQSQPWEVKLHGAGVPKVQGWWGHCNGWAASSALLPTEPREPVTVNGITFGVGDVKALLAEAGMSVTADFFGNRVDPWTMHQQLRWEDTVPGQYFLVLTNYMGKAGRTVLIDRVTGHEVWNQPVAGYRFKYPKPEDYLGCTGGICKINVESTMWWYNDSGVPPDILTPPFDWTNAVDPRSGAQAVEHRNYVMELWLDGPVEFGADGKITKSGDVVVTRDGEFFVGGTWKMGQYNNDGHPDYMWVPYSFVKPDPNEDYANPHVDIDWIKAHLLVPGGRDDTSVRPIPIPTAPSPRPSPSSSPGGSPTSGPTSTPTSNPWPIPFPTSTSTTAPVPMPMPTSTGSPTFPAPAPLPRSAGR